MSFQKRLILEFCLVSYLSLSKNVGAVYENNPFFQTNSNNSTTATPPSTQATVIIANKPTSTDSSNIWNGDDLRRKCLKPTGQFPSNSCNKYVNCWEGIAIEQSCPNGFLFSPIKLYCDFPENVDCQGKLIVSQVSSVLQSASESSTATLSVSNSALRKFCLKSGGLFPGSTCDKFVNCWDNGVVEMDCPTGLYFNPAGFCDYPENVFCERPEDSDKKTGTPSKDSECPLETGMFRNRTNCSRYYTCLFNKVVARHECPEGFSFSDLLGVCDYSSRVDCSKEPQIYQRQASRIPEERAKVSECPLENGMFRNRSSCSHYYMCSFDNVVGQFECPQGFSFSDLLGVCDYSSRVDCSREPQIYQKQTSEIPATNYSPCAGMNGLVRDKQNCSSYYLCDHGIMAANYICPIGFKFSNEIGVCDYEDKVNCNQPVKPFGMTHLNAAGLNLPKDVISKAQNCVPGSVFRLNPDCTVVCRCREGGAEIIECSLGLAYDSKLDKCISAHLAKC